MWSGRLRIPQRINGTFGSRGPRGDGRSIDRCEPRAHGGQWRDTNESR